MTIAALNRGDKVIATARKRSLSQLEDLKIRGAETLELDVTAPIEELKVVAKKAVAIYGKVDVIVNNAGLLLWYILPQKLAYKLHRIHPRRCHRRKYVRLL